MTVFVGIMIALMDAIADAGQVIKLEIILRCGLIKS